VSVKTRTGYSCDDREERTMTQPFGPPEPEPKFDRLLEQPPILENRLRAIENYVVVVSRRMTKLDAYVFTLAQRISRLESKLTAPEHSDHRMPDPRETRPS
jgi:hypothetical protein